MTLERLTVRQAAKATGTARTTLTRALEAGRVPGAVRTSGGWDVPVAALEAAGYTVDLERLQADGRPASGEPEAGARAADQPGTAELRERVAALEAEAAARADAEVAELRERVATLEAEAAKVPELRERAAVAEAVAAERTRHVESLQRSLDALAVQVAALTVRPRRREIEAEAVDRPGAALGPVPEPVKPRRRLFRRTGDGRP